MKQVPLYKNNFGMPLFNFNDMLFSHQSNNICKAIILSVFSFRHNHLDGYTV